MKGYGFKYKKHFYLCASKELVDEFIKLATSFTSEIDVSLIKIQSIDVEDDYFRGSPVEILGVGEPETQEWYDLSLPCTPPSLSNAEEAFNRATEELYKQHRLKKPAHDFKTPAQNGSGCIVPLIVITVAVIYLAQGII